MEVMYLKGNHDLFKEKFFTGVYGDKKDLYDADLIGIQFDDNWSVKRFLNGYKFKIDNKVLELLSDFDLNINILKRKICELSKGEYKLILLIYSLLNNFDNIVLDYFDKCLSYKYKKRVVSYLKSKYEGTLIVISNDIFFLNELCNVLVVFSNGKIVFNDKFEYLYKSNIKLDYPEIIKFIRLANKKRANLLYTVDSHELLKDIYRSIK